MRRLPAALALVVAAVATMLAGCAAPAPPTGIDAPSGEWRTYAAEVTGVRPGPTPNTVAVAVSLPDGVPGCAQPPRVELLEENADAVLANVVFSSARAQIYGGCPTMAPAEAVLTATEEIGARTVTLNQVAWTRDGAGFRRCPEEGCHPPADHCAPQWTLAAFNGLDVPRHAARRFEHCDQRWLIMTVDLNSSACGAGKPGCSAPPSVTRYFLRFDTAWRLFAQTRTAGCAAARAAAPDFPSALCADLGVPGPK